MVEGKHLESPVVRGILLILTPLVFGFEKRAEIQDMFFYGLGQAAIWTTLAYMVVSLYFTPKPKARLAKINYALLLVSIIGIVVKVIGSGVSK